MKKKVVPGSPEYRDLLNKISSTKINLPPLYPLSPLKSHAFTGNKDADMIILQNLDDYDLGRVCNVNKYTRDLCRNENFWMNRMLKRFSQFDSDIPVLRERLKLTWKQLYVKTIDMLERIYNGEDLGFIMFGRELQSIEYSKIPKLFSNMVSLLEERTDALQEAIADENFELAKEILSQDFINPNTIFFGGIDFEIGLNLVKKDKRFRPKALLSLLRTMFEKEAELILKELSPLLTWKDFLDSLFLQVDEGLEIYRPSIYLKGAVSKGATKDDIQNRLSKISLMKHTTYNEDDINRRRNINEIKKFISEMK